MYVGWVYEDAAATAVRNQTQVNDCIPLAWVKQEAALRENRAQWAHLYTAAEVEADVQQVEAELRRLGYNGQL